MKTIYFLITHKTKGKQEIILTVHSNTLRVAKATLAQVAYNTGLLIPAYAFGGLHPNFKNGQNEL